MGVATDDGGDLGTDEGAASRGGGRQDADVRARVAKFAARYGDGVLAVVNQVGRSGARIVLIAPNGEFGDALASSLQAGRQICRDAGIEVRDWDRETTGLLAPSRVDRVRMGTRQR